MTEDDPTEKRLDLDALEHDLGIADSYPSRAHYRVSEWGRTNIEDGYLIDAAIGALRERVPVALAELRSYRSRSPAPLVRFQPMSFGCPNCRQAMTRTGVAQPPHGPDLLSFHCDNCGSHLGVPLDALGPATLPQEVPHD